MDEDGDEDEFDEMGDVTASQIDTTVALSANTVDSLMDETNENENDEVVEGAETNENEEVVEMSQGAVLRAFDLPQRDGPHATGDESETLVSDGDDDGEGIDGVSIRVAPSDVNLLKDDEHSDEYEVVGSDGSGAGSESDGEPDRREYPEEVVLSDTEVESMDAAFIESLGGIPTLSSMDKAALRAMKWSPVSQAFEVPRSQDQLPGQDNMQPTRAYERLCDDVAAPIRELQRVADSPLLLFFYFVPKSLWVHICKETNRYKQQTDHARAVRLRSNQVRNNRVGTPETIRQIKRRLHGETPYAPHEIVIVLGLLMAHMMAPQKRFASHWSTTDDGATPAGLFGRFMARNRCTDILRDLHFANNEAPRARDKIWKLRPVVDKIQERFLSGWTLPAVFSFDEGVLPATSRREQRG